MLFALVANAIELPDIIGDNMMLQQQTQARLWGWAAAGNTIEVRTSWNNKTYNTRVAADGRWDITVATPKASYEQYAITFVEKKGQKQVDSQTAQNVLIGEVWFCSGQSNMEMPLGGFWNCPVEGANEAIALSAKYKKAIRVATIDRDGKDEPQKKVAGKWDTCEPKNAGKFSACGYFFAQTLTDMLDIPVGIINCSWGGSCVEGWMPKEILLTYPDGLTPMDDTSYHKKMVMFNGMLAPLAGYSVKGFLWNQGESNCGNGEEYCKRFSVMTRLWRKMWAEGGAYHALTTNDINALSSDKTATGAQLPIYAVELPGYRYGTDESDMCANFRVWQHKIKESLANYDCVTTTDLMYDYEPLQIHGCRKQPIGQRLAYLALANDYGMEGIGAKAPEFEYAEAHEASDADVQVIAGTAVEKNANEKGTVYHLYFTNSTDGFDRLSGIEGFEALGSDGQWHKATVWSDSAWQNVKRQGCFLKLVCPEAGTIKAIRYRFHNFNYGHALHNLRGLPVVPFNQNI